MIEKDQRKRNIPEVSLEANEDFFGINEEEETVPFQCIDCGCVDPVPDFIIDEMSFDLEQGEEVELYCPACNGTMRKIKEQPKGK